MPTTGCPTQNILTPSTPLARNDLRTYTPRVLCVVLLVVFAFFLFPTARRFNSKFCVKLYSARTLGCRILSRLAMLNVHAPSIVMDSGYEMLPAGDGRRGWRTLNVFFFPCVACRDYFSYSSRRPRGMKMWLYLFLSLTRTTQLGALALARPLGASRGPTQFRDVGGLSFIPPN